MNPLLLTLLLLCSLPTLAQTDTTIIYLHKGEPAPFAGVLIEEQTYERLRIGFIVRKIEVTANNALAYPCVNPPFAALNPKQEKALIRQCRANFWTGVSFGAAAALVAQFVLSAR